MFPILGLLPNTKRESNFKKYKKRSQMKIMVILDNFAIKIKREHLFDNIGQLGPRNRMVNDSKSNDDEIRPLLTDDSDSDNKIRLKF